MESYAKCEEAFTRLRGCGEQSLAFVTTPAIPIFVMFRDGRMTASQCKRQVCTEHGHILHQVAHRIVVLERNFRVAHDAANEEISETISVFACGSGAVCITKQFGEEWTGECRDVGKAACDLAFGRRLEIINLHEVCDCIDMDVKCGLRLRVISMQWRTNG